MLQKWCFKSATFYVMMYDKVPKPVPGFLRSRWVVGLIQTKTCHGITVCGVECMSIHQWWMKQVAASTRLQVGDEGCDICGCNRGTCSPSLGTFWTCCRGAQEQCSLLKVANSPNSAHLPSPLNGFKREPFQKWELVQCRPG